MDARQVGWSFHRDPDLIIEVWSTASLMEAVLEALLGDRLALTRAVAALAPGPTAVP